MGRSRREGQLALLGLAPELRQHLRGVRRAGLLVQAQRTRAMVWPSVTATRWTEAEMREVGAARTRRPSKRPRILRGSVSIFSSSPPPM